MFLVVIEPRLFVANEPAGFVDGDLGRSIEFAVRSQQHRDPRPELRNR